MKLPTPLTSLLNIDLPIIGAPMFLVSFPDLVVSVSEAGGLGTFPALNYRTIPELKDGLAEIRGLTKKPFGVNVILHREHNPMMSAQIDAILEARVPVVILSLGVPRTVIKEIKSTGAKVLCDVTTLRHAELVKRAGADVLVAVSQGAGGHAGNISPFSLIPYLIERTALPVIAAGSISNGQQMAAALALGAQGVYVGTRLIATPEANASPEYKQMLIDSQPEDIIYSPEVSGIHANWLKPSLEKAGFFEKVTEKKLTQTKQWKDIWSAGHGVAQINSIETVQKIISTMVDEYHTTLKKLP